MKLLSRVVWSEGMYLGPHEFQAQSRYFEDSIHFAANSLWFRGYGLTGISLDSDALRNGTLSLTHACGIFPDGTLFHMPQADQLPPVRSIVEEFPPTAESVTLYLGLQMRKPQAANCGSSVTSKARYVAEQREITDETTGTDTRAVKMGRKNIRFYLEKELNEEVISLPVARIKRDGAGHFVYDSDFIPTCLQIRASERLMLLVRREIEILEAKSSSLGRAASGISSGTQFSPREVANFWLLHCTNSGLSALRHLWMTKRGHPEELYLEMSRLAGALCTFSLDAHPRNLPVYDHDRPEHCFEELDRHIRANLETVVPTNCIAIPLTKTADCFWEADVSDSRTLGRARWILGIQAPVGEPELIARTPQLVKVCSAKFVGELVRRAIAGLALTHMPMPPSSVPMQMSSQYFSISREGPFWDHIVQTQRVGMYVPAELPNAELELFAVLER